MEPLKHKKRESPNIDVNGKRNHHFIAQTEQIFHARSKDVIAKKVNRFEVLNKFRLKKTSNKGVSIANNLSFEDLYCFDFISREQQHNFEDVFGEYEEKYNSIVSGVGSRGVCDDELYLNLFIYKWMNIIRNPFCIQDTISMFESYLDFIPTDPLLIDVYARIDKGNKPQEFRVCQFFGVTKAEYTHWLKIIFLVLFVNQDGINMLESIARKMFYSNENHVDIFVFSLSSEFTVFSDVGYTYMSQDSHLVFEFSLTESLYIAYCFTDLDEFINDINKERNIDLTNVYKYITSKPKKIEVHPISDDVRLLKLFNGRMIRSSKKYVYSKASKPLFD